MGRKRKQASTSSTSDPRGEAELNDNNNNPNKKHKSNDTKTNTIPIHRGKFKQAHLGKHASLITDTSEHGKGILVTCGVGMETRALGQAQQFLMKYLNLIYGEVKAVWRERIRVEDLDVDVRFCSDGEDEKDEKDGDKVNEEEKMNINEKDNTKRKDRIIQAVDSGCSGLLYFRFRNDVDPVDFMRKLLTHLHENEITTEESRSTFLKTIHFCHRFIPIQRVCPCALDEVVKSLEIVLQTNLPSYDTLKTIALSPSVTNCRLVYHKTDIIAKCAPLLPLKDSERWKVDLATPDVTVIIAVFKSVAAIAVYETMFDVTEDAGKNGKRGMWMGPKGTNFELVFTQDYIEKKLI